MVRAHTHPVFDNDLLLERLGHALSQVAGQRIRWPAGGKGHDDGDQPGRIVLSKAPAGTPSSRCCAARRRASRLM